MSFLSEYDSAGFQTPWNEKPEKHKWCDYKFLSLRYHCQNYSVDSVITLFIKWKIMLYYNISCDQCHLCQYKRPLDLCCFSGHAPCCHGFFKITGRWQTLSCKTETMDEIGSNASVIHRQLGSSKLDHLKFPSDLPLMTIITMIMIALIITMTVSWTTMIIVNLSFVTVHSLHTWLSFVVSVT